MFVSDYSSWMIISNEKLLYNITQIGFEWDPMRSAEFMVKKRANMFPRVNANW